MPELHSCHSTDTAGGRCAILDGNAAAAMLIDLQVSGQIIMFCVLSRAKINLEPLA
jgi:hypothetical protein